MLPRVRKYTCMAVAPLLCAVAAADAWSRDLFVPASPDALQITIDKAGPGDVIRLGAGKHTGPIVLKFPMSIEGEPGAAIDGGKTGSVITVDAPDVTVSGITITGSGSSHEARDSGIKLTRKALRASVTDNRLEGNLVGIDIRGAKDALAKANTIIGRRGHRVNQRGNGIYVWNAPGAIVEDNDVRYGRDGIFVNTSRKNIFRNNTFRDLRFAVHYMYANKSEVSGNISRGNHIGYALMFSKDLVIRDNISDGDRDHGIMLNYANKAQVKGNHVNGAHKCVFIYNANKNTISGNRFERCGIGIHFTAGSERNRMSENAFIGNRTQVKYVGSRWLDWSADGRGNYWSDHVAYDINGDGLADSAYRPNDVMDNILWSQPATRLLLGSPAVQLIRWTQSRFPALFPGGVIDTKPLIRPIAGLRERRKDQP